MEILLKNVIDVANFSAVRPSHVSFSFFFDHHRSFACYVGSPFPISHHLNIPTTFLALAAAKLPELLANTKKLQNLSLTL